MFCATLTKLIQPKTGDQEVPNWPVRYTGRKRSASALTAGDFSQQQSNMVRYTRRRARTSYRRGGRAGRTVRRSRSGPLRRVISTVRRLDNVATLAKHILCSDAAVNGGFQTVFSGTALLNSSPLIQLMNPCARGLTVQARIGDYINVTKIHYNVRMTFGPNITGDAIVKWILFAHKTPGGASLSATQFVTDYFGTNTPKTNAIPNYNNKTVSARYRILKRGTVYMRSSVSSVTEIRDFQIKWIPKTPLRISYVLGNTGGVADMDQNAIYLIMYTDGGNAVSGINSFIEGNIYYHDA